MLHRVRIHYDNKRNFTNPMLWVWVSDGTSMEKEIAPAGEDHFGVYFDLYHRRSSFHFKFKGEKGGKEVWEDEELDRFYRRDLGDEIWTMSGRHNIYNVLPARPVGSTKMFYGKIKHLIPEENFYLPETDVSGMGVPSLLGANLLEDGSILFGFFHPRAARVYLTGSMNGWQHPGHPRPQRKKFLEMKLYRGFYNQPNIWLIKIKPRSKDANPENIQYKFYIQGGAVENEKFTPDPYTRVYSDDYKFKNSRVVDPTRFPWSDSRWKTPPVKDLILYELNVYGFTDNDPAIPEEYQGTFKGVTYRIKNGYFNNLGVTAIALMPVAEVPRKRGLGYEPCTFMAVEKDFGTPDDFREMVDTAHRYGLAVIVDKVFNHTSNDFNPLWNLIDDGSEDGGFYFSGGTMWGNKVATGRDEVDNMLIDSCKLFIREYHIDGFRFDATHSYFLNHKLLHRIAHEIKDSVFKRDAILIAENLPNEQDLNLEGYNGYAQWSDIFHDKIKALLREGEFEGVDNSPEDMGSMFYFSKGSYAAHTNNAINYCESHDENSVQYEVATGGEHLQSPEIKDRKARLGLMATMVALGQPMIYMGQEFGIERERNRIDVNWVKKSKNVDRFFRWARDLIRIRNQHDALKQCGYNPIVEGTFSWMLGPWMEKNKGGGKRVIGWKAHSDSKFPERLAVMMNFEGHDIAVDLNLEKEGCWFKLVDIDRVTPLTDCEKNNPWNNLYSGDGTFKHFVLPPYSGFIYKYQPETAPLLGENILRKYPKSNQ